MTNTDRYTDRDYTVVLRETYRDHELVALTKFFPAGSGRSSLDYTDVATGIDDRFFRPSKATYEGVKNGSDAEARKFLQQAVDEMIADEEILPKLLPLVAADKNGESLAVLDEEPKPGDIVYVFAMGYFRRGLATRTTRTKVEVAYTTASSNGRVFRKLARRNELLIDG